MNQHNKFPFFLFFSAGCILIVSLCIRSGDLSVLDPSGWIGVQEKNLFFTATAWMLVVVLPALLLTVVFAWKYRSNNPAAKYSPEWDYNATIESLWWGLPCIIVAILSVITWKASHELDPFRPISSNKSTMTIQVIALQWKWLFLYPEYNIASINEVHFPKDTPVHFQITADAPMNSFWIPKLGGQVYAMPAMQTSLHLIANEKGTFRGSSANLSGEGFAGMIFSAVSESEDEFLQWVQLAKTSSPELSLDIYRELAKPSQNNPVSLYPLVQENLYDWIIMKYMMPQQP